MRIGFDITSLTVPQSGVGTYTLNLLEQLAYEEQDEVVLLSHRPPQREYAISDCRVALPWWGRGGINKTLWMQAILPWQLSRMGVTVSHFTNNVAPLLTPFASIITIHDMTLWLFPEHHYRRRLLAMRPFIPLAARRAAAIITVSHSAKRDIVRILGVPAEKVHVVYEAPAAIFRLLPPGAALERVRRKYDLPEHFALYVGTIEPRKNLVRLLEAWACLRRRTEGRQTLLFVGSRGWKDREVFATVERLALGDSVRFLNHIPTSDLVALYNLADALTFPSLYEGFGLPVVEAMACGTPVVTSATGSLLEIAEGAAEFVEPDSIESITEGLQRVLSSPALRAELRAHGLDRVTTYSWEHAANLTRQLYGTVANCEL
ncbi:MAG: glycosyltransferase family 4 protein [Ardenticatenaceae bacterium]